MNLVCINRPGLFLENVCHKLTWLQNSGFVPLFMCQPQMDTLGKGSKSLDKVQREGGRDPWPCASIILFSCPCKLCCTLYPPVLQRTTRLKVLEQHLAIHCRTSPSCSERLVLGLRRRGHGERAGLLPAGFGAYVLMWNSVRRVRPRRRSS